eukprot:TRINITY_DN10423_c0_g1_i2.p1 TRINITY_DN10423_c0_g1~~TRINITY_DN10423_c0_g1_i2.p1  ORF type:complete len:905 (+),score=359.87 TRINITY_DN10423_c0_g1_i2:62-2716(+)
MQGPRLKVDADATARAGRCDARALWCCGGYLWVAETCATGRMVVRDTRTGGEVARVAALGDGVKVNAFATWAGSVCVGGSDGRVRVYSPDGGEALTIIDTRDGGDVRTPVTALTTYGAVLYVGCGDGRLRTVSAVGDASIATAHSFAFGISHLAMRPGVVFVGLESGHVATVSVASDTGEPAAPPTAPSKIHTGAVTSMAYVGAGDTLWVAGNDGRVVVLDAAMPSPWPRPLATLVKHHHPGMVCTPDTAAEPVATPPRNIGSAGGLNLGIGRLDTRPSPVQVLDLGKVVLTGGPEGTLALWDARERGFGATAKGDPKGLLSVLPRHHHGGIRHMALGGQSTHTRAWTYGGDRKLALLGVPAGGATGEAMEEEHMTPALGEALQQALLDKAHMGTKIRQLQQELKAADSRNGELVGAALRTRGFETEAQAASQRLLTDLELQTASVADLRNQITLLKSDLDAQKTAHGKVVAARDEAEAKCVKAEAAARDKEKEASEADRKLKASEKDGEKLKKEVDTLKSKVKMTETRLADKQKTIDTFQKQLNDSKDQVLTKDVAFKKADTAKKDMEKTVTTSKTQATQLENKLAVMEGSVKTLKAQLLMKTNEIAELVTARDEYKTKLAKAAGELETAIKVIEVEEREKRGVADTAVLARNEVEILRRERAEWMGTASRERAVLMNNEGLVHEQKQLILSLQEALGQERDNKKTLEDQYTIFQFVINSRGELVSTIWALHDLMKKAKGEVKALDDFIRRTVLPVLKQGDKEACVCLAGNVHTALQMLQQKNDYIVANYFTEYEKLHFGISSYHFFPDTRRPQVVGDTMLSKLQQVTPAKLFRRGDDDGPSHLLQPNTGRDGQKPKAYTNLPYSATPNRTFGSPGRKDRSMH